MGMRDSIFLQSPTWLPNFDACGRPPRHQWQQRHGATAKGLVQLGSTQEQGGEEPVESERQAILEARMWYRESISLHSDVILQKWTYDLLVVAQVKGWVLQNVGFNG